MLRSKGSILVVFIMLVALASLVFIFISFITTRVVESRIRQYDLQAFYVAEAGLNKAVWTLLAPTSEGGSGTSWRTTGTTQNFDGGFYIMRVTASTVTGEVRILSTGEVRGIRKTLLYDITGTGLPPAFNYSVFGNSNILLGRSYAITGDMFINGNTVFEGSGTGGNVYHTAGKTVTGGGTDKGVPSTIPTFPVMDTSYYSNQITLAGGVAAGNQSWSNTTVNLGGSTIYVNGSAVFSSVTFNGPGMIVATGNITFQNGPNTGNNASIKVISGAAFSSTGDNTRLNNFTYYGQTSVSMANSYSGTGNVVLSNGNISLSGNVAVSGLLYSKAGSVSLSGSSNVTGSIVAATGVTADKADITITYSKSAFENNVPPGFPTSQYSPKKGSWNQI